MVVCIYYIYILNYSVCFFNQKQVYRDVNFKLLYTDKFIAYRNEAISYLIVSNL